MATDQADQTSSDPGSQSARRLAAILHADVVGYSRLMELDEDGTHSRVRRLIESADRIIAEHGGRTVGTAGDSFLAEFPSVIEAIAAAMAIRDAAADGNTASEAGREVRLRMGINLGDVIADGRDIFGDGVNIAARIQALAAPDEIWVSGAVFDQVRNRANLRFEDRGRHAVKNIAEPVRAYALAGEGRAKPAGRPSNRLRLALAVALAGLVAVGIALWSDGLRWPLPPANDRPQVASGRPTVAVLPFEDRTSAGDDAYFADGLTEDIINALGRFSGLSVLSWNAVAVYRGTVAEPAVLHRKLGVRYIVGGSVRRSGDRIRVAVQLTDAEKGVLLWSERYDRQRTDIFALQDEITGQIVSVSAVQVSEEEMGRAAKKRTDHFSAYESALKGREMLRVVRRRENLKARSFFEQALAVDPDYPDAMVGVGMTLMNDFFYGWSEWPNRALQQAVDLARKAIAIDRSNALAHALLAYAHTFQGRFGEARDEIRTAIELNPNDAFNYAIYGTILTFSGEPAEAVGPLERALVLDPNGAAWWLTNLAQAYYMLGRYEDTIELMVRHAPYEEDPVPYLLMAAAYGQLGKQAEARTALASLHRISPFFDTDTFARNLPSQDQTQRLLDGLRKVESR